MAKYLVILESPGKISKVSSILGKDYKVMATKGHFQKIKDSGKYKIGLNFDTYEEEYQMDPSKADNMKLIKKEADKATIVYIASDADREGMSIAYEVEKFLKLPKSKVKRAIFFEITEKAVKEGIKNAGSNDENMASSGRARAVLDKSIGYRLSNTVASVGFKSAGRVQSAALLILALREKEINAFKSKTYYELYLDFEKNNKLYTAKYVGTEKKKITKFDSEVDCGNVILNCTKDFVIKNINQTSKSVAPKPVFTTSTFQQDCSNKLNYPPKKAMTIAQSLYEQGYISYHRTDSMRLSESFVEEAKIQLDKDYPDLYHGYRGDKVQSGAQNAHEGIRPTHASATPGSLKGSLKPDEFKVYSLIYNRTMASLMKNAIIKRTEVIIENNGELFAISGNIPEFLGYRSLYEEYSEEDDEAKLPTFTNGEKIVKKDLYSVKKQTTPPARYTEATLIKEMETCGIGRPSTMAPTITTLLERNYCEKQGKSLVPTEGGMKLSDLLQKYFPSIISIKYTAEMELILDEIAEGKKERPAVLKEFWEEFNPKVIDANKKIAESKPPLEKLDLLCPECGRPLVKRKTRDGSREFISCSGFPRCRYTAPNIEAINDKKSGKKKTTTTKIKCEKCNSGYLIQRTSKTGEVFYGCSCWPKCSFTIKLDLFKEKYGKKK